MPTTSKKIAFAGLIYLVVLIISIIIIYFSKKEFENNKELSIVGIVFGSIILFISFFLTITTTLRFKSNYAQPLWKNLN